MSDFIIVAMLVVLWAIVFAFGNYMVIFGDTKFRRLVGLVLLYVYFAFAFPSITIS